MPKSWEKISSQALGDFRIFTLRSDRKISPRTREPHDFFVIDSVNWVNVIALTPDQQLIMVEQYRHGSDTVELEIPGGMMDATDGRPSPVFQTTGSESVTPVGSSRPEMPASPPGSQEKS